MLYYSELSCFRNFIFKLFTARHARNISDFCMLIVHPAPLRTCLRAVAAFLCGGSSGLLRTEARPPRARAAGLSPPLLVPVFVLRLPARASFQRRTEQKWRTCRSFLVSSFREKAFSHPPQLRMMLTSCVFPVCSKSSLRRSLPHLISWEFLSQLSVALVCVYWDDHVVLSFILSMRCIPLSDFRMFIQTCSPGTNPTWS